MRINLYIKKIVLVIAILSSSLMVVNANSVSSIDMDIFIDSNGAANVTETWRANVTEGTEGYHPYYNLGDATISDLSVSMDGKNFDTVSNWNINNSFSEKSYRAGIYNAGSGEVDICFGISDYGTHTYVVNYKINGFVVKLNDADMVYWNLFPKNFSARPDNVNIKISSDFRYEDSLDVWGYGNYGSPCYVYDGVIEMTSDGPISSSEYLTILVKFPSGTFNTYHTIDKNFKYYHDMAEEGAVNYEEKGSNALGNWATLFGVISFLFSFIFSIVPIILIIVFVSKYGGKNSKYQFGEAGNNISKDVPYFRDIPCNKDIYRAYWVASNYGLNSKKEDFLGCIILKWIQDGVVSIDKVVSQGLLKTKEEINVIFNHDPGEAIELEKELYKWMYKASRDGKLEKNEFKKWCNKNYSKILGWFDKITKFEEKMLINENKITVQSEKIMGIFNHDVYYVDSSMKDEALQMAGLKKFLNDFTLIKERESIEVNLWNEYLMYAQIFGIADKVASQFKKLYPEIVENMNSCNLDYADLIFINEISHIGISSASSAKSRAESYSSGGGGFSSGGGGGGSFGGGGGGGGFR